MKDFNVLWLKLYWSKTHEIKSKFKFNLYLTFKIINIHNRSCRELFFVPVLNRFIAATYWRISTGPAQARKQYAHNKTRFSYKIKDWIILFELEGILKIKLLKAVQARFKDITLCHNVNQMTKYESYPNSGSFRRYFNKTNWEKASVW